LPLRAMVLAATFSILILGSAAATSSPQSPGAGALDDPLIRQKVAQQRHQIEAEQRQRSSPQALAARTRSRTAYVGLSGSQAEALAGDAFPSLLDPTWAPYRPSEGESVVRYLGSHSALVAPDNADLAIGPSPGVTPTTVAGNDPAGLVESLAPLRASESGALKPLDSTSIDHGAYVEPANAPVEAELPDDLSSGIRLPELDVIVIPEGASQAAPASQLGADKRFYANSDIDTDLLATATAAGVETFIQLRSTRSPEQQRLELDLPANATLKPAFEESGALIERDGEPIATVSPPTAFDASGAFVPVEMTISGHGLELTIEHRSGDWQYPILVDPVLEQFDFNWWGGCADLTFWHWDTSNPGTIGQGCGQVTPPGSGYAIATQANGINWFNPGAWGEWWWEAPSNTFIEKAEFLYTDQAYSAGEDVCTTQGIWDPASGWQGGFGADLAGYFYGVSTQCGTWSWQNWSQNVGWYSDLTTDPGDPQGADGNMAAFHLSINSGGVTWHWGNSWDLMRAANFTVFDRNDPVYYSSPPASDSQWIDDTPTGGGIATHSHTVTANDPGVGMKQYWLWQSDPNGPYTVNGSRYNIAVTNRPCSGLRPTGGCRSTWAQPLNYQLAEGRTSMSVSALDQIGRASPTTYGWTHLVDRSAPTVAAPTGSFYSNRTSINGSQSYDLTVSATDGNAATDATMRSGVKRLEVLVDDDEDEASFSVERPSSQCNLAGGACPSTLQGTWHLDPYTLGEGQHTISVVATDQAGHQTAETVQQFTVNVVTDIAPAELTVVATPPLLDGSYTIIATAIDVQTQDRPVSGMGQMELLVDGVSVDNYEAPCSGSSCTIVRTYQMNASQSLDQHEATIITHDKAGNGTMKPTGNTQRFYDLFGYNEGPFGPQKLRAAFNGGANVIRTGISWCSIADSANPNVPRPRNEWDWGPVTSLFRETRDFNAGIAGTEDDLRVVAILYNSPRWAREDAGNSCDTVAPPSPSRVPGDDSDWSYFVKEFTTRFGPNPRSGDESFVGANLTAVELWNEPNLAKFWGNGTPNLIQDAPQRFADLVNAGAAAVRSAAPSVKVLPGGLSPIRAVFKRQKSFIEAATTGVARPINPNLIDGVSVHLYADRSPSETRAINKVKSRYNNLIGSLGPLSSKPRWITEIGFPSAPLNAGQTEITQRERLKEAYKQFGNTPNVKAFIIHRLVDDDDNGKQYGVLQEGLSACKPVYSDLASFRNLQSRVVCPPPAA
jgi:hypothetical protein